MSRTSDRDLVPRNGHTLMAGLAARISGCASQKELSLEDQTDHNKAVVADYYSGSVEYMTIATKGKGERLDRPELAQIEAAFRKRNLDVFVIEDLGRLVRGVEAVRLLGIAVDHGVRVIVPNDNIDTARESWEHDAIKASADHVAHNAHTSRRLKMRLKNRFEKFGGAFGRPIAGYIVPENAKSYDDWIKDPKSDSKANADADPWIYDGAKLLRETLNCSAIADMLNARDIATGPYCRSEKWDGQMVRRFYSNPLLKGMPRRNEMHSVKFHEIGQRRSVKNPAGPVFYPCPHLAYFDALEFDELEALLKKRNARCGRPPVNGQDPLLRVPRKRTRFPGQHGRCWYCGYQHVWGGNGMTGNLMCGNARNRHCWNGTGYNGELAVTRLMEVVTQELYQLEGFDAQYRELVERAGFKDSGDAARRHDRLEQDEQALEVKRDRFLEAIAKYGAKPMFDAQMEAIEADELRLRIERRDLEHMGGGLIEVPDSLSELRAMLEREFVRAAHDSPEFGSVLRKICPDFFVYLVRLCDGGPCLPRARVRLAFDGMISGAVQVPGIDGLLRRDVTLDLFVPPPHVRIRADAVQWKAQGLGPAAIAAKIRDLTDERPSERTVRNALALDDRMQKLGLASPYQFLTSPPDDIRKLRRHKNPNYQFLALEGYVPMELT